MIEIELGYKWGTGVQKGIIKYKLGVISPHVTVHLLTMFGHNSGMAVKYYITNTLKKPN
jgi:hypothetical protein